MDREYDDRNFPVGVPLVDVIAALGAGMDEPSEPTILAIHNSPEVVPFITHGDAGDEQGWPATDLAAK